MFGEPADNSSEPPPDEVWYATRGTNLDWQDLLPIDPSFGLHKCRRALEYLGQRVTDSCQKTSVE
jgi:hypothetical protein